MRRYLLFLIFVLCFCFASGAEARKLALLVGVNEYAKVPSLRCCVNDMQALKEALINIGFKERDIVLFTTGGALRDLPTKEKIEQKVDEILSAAQEDDMVFFAFSGHGAREGQTDYFCPPFADPNDIEGTCVSITQVMDDLSQCPAQFKWMVVDACRNDPNNSRDAKAFQVISVPPAGIALFQSCDKGEKSYEESREGGHGYFTKNLIAALSGKADANHDGKLTLFEVCAWTADQTQAEVEQAEHKTQKPFLNIAVTNFTLSENMNIQKAKKLVDEARIAVEEEKYDLAVRKYDEAIALCPQYKSLRRERNAAQRLHDAKTKFDPMNIVVPGNFPTIEDAYKNANDGGIITIQPGKYDLSATIVVDRNVTFRGSSGRPEDVVIECASADVFRIIDNSPSFQNLTASSGEDTCAGFYITGGTPKLFHCVVTSRKGTGIYVQGENAKPQVESCVIKNCGEAGVKIEEDGRGSFTNCEIYGNALVGIQVSESSDPTVTGCKIHDNKGGLLVNENGQGIFKDCEIYKNAVAGIAVITSGNPNVTRCKIYDEIIGVTVEDEGLGSFNNCEIYRTQRIGFGAIRSGNPTVTRCKIHDSKEGVGVLVSERGHGKFSDCEIYGFTLPGIVVTASGSPTVTGCRIHDNKSTGVVVKDRGMGTFNNNTLERNYWNGDLYNWFIESTAGAVRGYGNTPPISGRN